MRQLEIRIVSERGKRFANTVESGKRKSREEKREQRRIQGVSPLGTMNMDSVASRRNRHWDDKISIPRQEILLPLSEVKAEKAEP